jgi:divalent metal cation (Fe/Co/Zn/Cd) transporter
MPPTVVGLFTGLLLGIAWVVGGFAAFVGVAVLGAAGFVIGKAVTGELDLMPYIGGGSRRGSP